MISLDTIIGDVGTGGAPSLPLNMPPDGTVDYGPVSPEQLAHLNRPLSKEEQKAADEWNAKQKSSVKSAAKKAPEENFLTKEAFAGLAVWQVALGALGLVSIGIGVYSLTGSKK